MAETYVLHQKVNLKSLNLHHHCERARARSLMFSILIIFVECFDSTLNLRSGSLPGAQKCDKLRFERKKKHNDNWRKIRNTFSWQPHGGDAWEIDFFLAFVSFLLGFECWEKPGESPRWFLVLAAGCNHSASGQEKIHVYYLGTFRVLLILVVIPTATGIDAKLCGKSCNEEKCKT